MIRKLWRAWRQNHLVWHRVKLVPGDDEKIQHLGLIQHLVFGIPKGGWNFRISQYFADNARRRAMQDAVDAWYALEDAMHRVREHEKDNKVAVDYAHEFNWRGGASDWKQGPWFPREGLIPIPPEFKDVKRRWDRATTDERGRPLTQRLNPDAPPETITAFFPEGLPTPDLRLDGKSSTQEWTHPSERRGGKTQRSKRRKKKGDGILEHRSRLSIQGLDD